MKTKIIFLILFIVHCFCNLYGQVTQEWVARFNPGNANSIAVDGSGNVYVTGSRGTIKYNSSGDSLWFAAEAVGDSQPSLVVDGSGNVYVTRFSGSDYATIKYNSSGAMQWIQRDEGQVLCYGSFPSLSVDGSGNVYVTGYNNRNGTYYDYTTIKYSSSGDSLWVARYDNGYRDYANSIAVDGSGNVYVTGVSGVDYATIKYNSSGDSVWVARYSSFSGGILGGAKSIAVDGSGNVYVTGSSISSETGSDYATIKYNSSGNLLWVQRYDRAYEDYAFSLAVDNTGNVYVTGYSGSFKKGFSYATIKYDSSGIRQWVQLYPGPKVLGDEGGLYVDIPIAIDGSGNVYVTGCSSNGIGHDYATIKYNSSGVQQWVQRYSATGNEGAHSLAVDNSGNIYVTGWGPTIKYSQTESITAPSNLNAQSIDSSFIKVKWQDNSNDEDGFYIERTQINDSSHWEVIGSVPQNVIQYSDYFVSRGLKYFYRVKAYSGNIHSGYSNTDSAILGGDPSVIPAAPSNLILFKRTANTIVMNWHDNSGNENGFIISRKTDGDLFFVVIDSVGTDVVTYQEVGVSTGHNYSYKICSYNSSGISDYSNTLIVLAKSAPVKTPQLSDNYILYENYPNPFNPVTKINYELRITNYVTLKVYDILGKEILTLVNEKQNAGTYSVEWYAGNYPSGVYFYKLTVDGVIIDTKRMMLLK